MTYGSIIKTDLKDHSQGSPSPLPSERSEVSETATESDLLIGD